MRQAKECPRCGKERFDLIEIPEWLENKTDILISCGNCEIFVRGTLPEIPEEFSTKCRGCLKEFRPIGQKRGKGFLCEDCEDKEIILDGDFGIVIPEETNKIYKNQTGGMLCSRRWIEGKKILLDRPQTELDTKLKEYKYRFDSDYRNDGDMLAALKDANYNHDSDKAKDIWKDIREKLPFKFEEVESPENEMSNTEAFKWIKITEIDEENFPSNDDVDVVGRKVVLHYPNCD
jgi:hypothetical protein